MFRDRVEAGEKLREKLLVYKKDHPVILAIPRGGVSVAFVAAKTLRAVMDIFVVRKIGAPHNPEFGIGAICEGGIMYLNRQAIVRLDISQQDLLEIIKKEEMEVERRAKLYRGGRPLISIKNRTVILIDDGLATGVTARAAIRAIKQMKPKKLIFAAPVCAKDTLISLSRKVTSAVCITTPNDLQSIGSYYRNFNQVADEEVIGLLQKINK